jgi:hypothetical protein
MRCGLVAMGGEDSYSSLCFACVAGVKNAREKPSTSHTRASVTASHENRVIFCQGYLHRIPDDSEDT